MAKQLSAQQEKLFQFLSRYSTGDSVEQAAILDGTGWKKSTMETYERKNMLDPFLANLGDEQYRILRDGSSLSKGDIASAFTQVRPGLLVLTKGMRIAGAKSQYELVKYLGEGAVAHVWEGRSATATAVALKVMNPRPDLLEPTNLENVRARFRREASNGLALQHDHVVKYLDTGDVGQHPFIVMELAVSTAAGHLTRQGPLSVTEAARVVRECCSGLLFLHGQGCVHRDIKPQNILIIGERHVLGDLGIVRWSDMNPAFTSAATITRASMQLGSWYYMAPEQRRGPHEASPKSDTYSLGITWYELLSGRVPDPAEVGAKQFAPPSSNAETNHMIASMVSFSPDERPTIASIVAFLANQTP